MLPGKQKLEKGGIPDIVLLPSLLPLHKAHGPGRASWCLRGGAFVCASACVGGTLSNPLSFLHPYQDFTGSIKSLWPVDGAPILKFSGTLGSRRDLSPFIKSLSIELL